MEYEDQTELFVAKLSAAQSRIYTYILTLLPDPQEAADVMQETSVTLWRKREEALAADNFVAWSLKVAYFQVKSRQRQQIRDRHQFSGALLERVAAESARQSESDEMRVHALRACLKKLPEEDQKVMALRYTQAQSVSEMADQKGKTVNAISRQLYRLRKRLLQCIQLRLKAEAMS